MKQKLVIFGAITSFFICIFGCARVGALSSNISPPVDPNTSWFICQGYNSPRTHIGGDALSLDLTRQACDLSPVSNTSSAGASVYAPLSGRVYWYSAAAGALCLNTSDGRSVALIHIDSNLSSGSVISTAQRVGSIAAAGTKGNAGIAHLHIQMWASPNCYNANQISFSTANRARICGAPDMTMAGPNSWKNGTWSGTTLTARSCAYITPKPAGSIYRFWSDSKRHHFYTASYDEAQHVADTWPGIWTYEPAANFSVSQVDANNACPANTQPVFRFWSDKYQGHFYTIDPAEKAKVLATWPDVWNYEKISYCASSVATSTHNDPLYRFWSDKYRGHFYTTDPAEKDRVIATWPDVWSYEGVAYYVKK